LWSIDGVSSTGKASRRYLQWIAPFLSKPEPYVLSSKRSPSLDAGLRRGDGEAGNAGVQKDELKEEVFGKAK